MANSIVRSAIFFGKVVTSDLPHAIKVSVPKYVMDPRLTMVSDVIKIVTTYLFHTIQLSV